MPELNPADLFRHETDLVHLKAGQTLIREGEPSDFMYVMTDGTAEISIRGQVVEIAGSGTLIGEMAMIDPAPRSATVTAKTDCAFVRIDQRRFDFLVSQTPHFARHVMLVMAARLRRVDASIR